jgi:hypothetical protein
MLVSARARPCDGCGRPIVWTVTPRGAWVPVLLSSYRHDEAIFNDEATPIYEPRRGHRSHYRRECRGSDSAPPTSAVQPDPFIDFVKRLPPKLVYYALQRHLHPDVGGDLRLCQDLTAAWDASRKAVGR